MTWFHDTANHFVDIYGYRGVQLEDVFKVGYVVNTEVVQGYHFYSTVIYLFDLMRRKRNKEQARELTAQEHHLDHFSLMRPQPIIL
jgi:hypothetical protein